MSSSDRQVWTGMLTHLRAHSAPLCRHWFDQIEPSGIASGVLRLRAVSDVQRDYLRARCLEPFNDAARTASQRLLTVQFFGPDDSIEPAPPEKPEPAPPQSARPDRPAGGSAVFGPSPSTAGGPGGSAPPPRPGAFDTWSHSLVFNPDYAFEHFVVGPGNRLAHAAALAVAQGPGRAYNPYFVHGNVGLGKTHLLQAICLRIRETNPKARIYYTSCEGFMTQWFDAVRAGEMSEFRHTFRDVDVLAIDDIHFLAKRDQTQEEFFHTFNTLYQAHKQIVLSSDAPPEEIPALEERLVSRFKWGLVTSVAAPGYETRVEILKNKARLRGFELPDDVACSIASRYEKNIRELEGAIVQLQILAAVENKPVDQELARQALGQNGEAGDRHVQIQTIIETVTDFYGVKITELQSKRRHRSVALPRQVCMYLARRFTRYSLEEIGGYFGGRDHTTVMHAVRTVEGRRDTDEEFAKIVQSLEQSVRGAA